MENIHAETYSLLVATLIPGVSEQTQLFIGHQQQQCRSTLTFLVSHFPQ
jgi:hypothetical protein